MQFSSNEDNNGHFETINDLTFLMIITDRQNNSMKDEFNILQWKADNVTV